MSIESIRHPDGKAESINDGDNGFNSDVGFYGLERGQYDPYGPRIDPYGQRYGHFFDRRRRQPGYMAPVFNQVENPGGENEVGIPEDETDNGEKPDFPFLYLLRNNYR